ncbi:MAG TPA: lactate 2-monooxygenase [Ohtaekwangia sp.]|uniref:lactate 2-monooxygenase n=2 Tax=Ohtaekwangia sp. TaxID=2066019 RepID=UPI002F921413
MKFSASDWQKEIYLNGFAGIRPKINVDPVALEQAAKRHMSRKAYAYIAGGAGMESTVQNNRQVFAHYSIVPRMLCNVSERDTSITLFGHKLPSPFLLSPVGVLEMVHRDADIAVAKAAASLGIPYIFSNQASKPMEQCAAVMNNSPRWFQLYWSKSRELVASFVQRAEHCGCSAIVVTLDTTLLGWRTRDLELAYLPFLEGKGIAQYTSDPVFQKMLDEPEDRVPVNRKITFQSIAGLVKMVNNYPGSGFIQKLRSGRPVQAVQKFTTTYSNPATTWSDLSFLQQHTKLPILLKGILHPDDARKAIDHGMDGIIISNHGGRQVDGAIATLDALPAVAEVVRKQIPILLDSGIRGGADAFKALALGATAICIGRPYVYGLAIAGEHGVYTVLRNFMADFELTMGLAGCKDVTEITAERLQRH